MSRRTKIVATIGPASSGASVLREVVEAGMDVARLGFAHGSPDAHIGMVAQIRDAASAARRAVGVLVDLPGPKVRTGPFPEPATLVDWTPVVLEAGSGPSSAKLITVDYPSLAEDLEGGDQVILGDGAVVLRVCAHREAQVLCEVVHGGIVQGRPGVHLPTGKVRLAAPTEEDLRLLALCLESGVDLVALSFVKCADDILRARAAVPPGGPKPLFVAKIETPVAVEHLDEIVEVADAVMVARGDLGTLCPIEDVPHLQKHIVRSCVLAGKPVITATQMLESMIQAPTPTRAEACDIANAVLDGTDAVMLSAETAVGVDPANAVRTMARIAERAEREVDISWLRNNERRVEDRPPRGGITRAIAHASWTAASDAGAVAILCCTWSGATVRALARYRPAAELIALTPSASTRGQVSLSWGARPLVLEEFHTSDQIVRGAMEAAVRGGYAKPGEVVAILAGSPHEDPAAVNDVLRLVRIPG